MDGAGRCSRGALLDPFDSVGELPRLTGECNEGNRAHGFADHCVRKDEHDPWKADAPGDEVVGKLQKVVIGGDRDPSKSDRVFNLTSVGARRRDSDRHRLLIAFSTSSTVIRSSRARLNAASTAPRTVSGTAFSASAAAHTIASTST